MLLGVGSIAFGFACVVQAGLRCLGRCLGFGFASRCGKFQTDPVPGNEVMFSDTAPLGSSTDAATNASWDVLAPDETIEFTGNYAVVRADIDNLQ